MKLLRCALVFSLAFLPSVALADEASAQVAIENATVQLGNSMVALAKAKADYAAARAEFFAALEAAPAFFAFEDQRALIVGRSIGTRLDTLMVDAIAVADNAFASAVADYNETFAAIMANDFDAAESLANGASAQFLQVAQASAEISAYAARLKIVADAIKNIGVRNDVNMDQ